MLLKFYTLCLFLFREQLKSQQSCIFVKNNDMIGTVINAAAIIVGGSVGLLVHTRLPEKIIKIVFQAIGLFTLFIGMQMALKTENILYMVMSIVLGAIIGETLDIDGFLQKIANNSYGKVTSAGKIQRLLYRKSSVQTVEKQHYGVVNAIIAAFLLFCMGSMSILGAIEDGLGNPPNLLLAKSVLDGFTAIALTASMGVGILLSVIPLLIFQGSITLLASHIMHVFGETVITELTAIGGLLLIGLGITMLEIKKISVVNMLPALIIIVVFTYFF